MMTYYDISMPLRCLVILGLFFLVCLGGYLFPAVCRRKKWMPKVLMTLAMVLCAVPMVIYVAEAQGMKLWQRLRTGSSKPSGTPVTAMSGRYSGTRNGCWMSRRTAT